jgi:hypothetical protein
MIISWKRSYKNIISSKIEEQQRSMAESRNGGSAKAVIVGKYARYAEVCFLAKRFF